MFLITYHEKGFVQGRIKRGVGVFEGSNGFMDSSSDFRNMHLTCLV